MQNIKYGIDYSRALLERILQDVLRHRPTILLRMASTTKHGRLWTFKFGKFKWSGRCTNAYEARAKGWVAWLHKQHAEGYEEWI